MVDPIKLVDRHRNGLRMDMTALIDCVFLLLIFFLLTSTYVNRRELEVDLPSITAGVAVETVASRVVVTVDRAGQLFMDDEPVSDEEVMVRLGALAEVDREQRVSIEADREAPAGRVIFVLDAARAARLSAVDLQGRNAASGGSVP